MVRALRAERGPEHGTVQRVATQLGYGTESVRLWVRQADIDEGHAPGLSTQEAARIAGVGAGEPGAAPGERDGLERASSFFGAELNHQQEQ